MMKFLGAVLALAATAQVRPVRLHVPGWCVIGCLCSRVETRARPAWPGRVGGGAALACHWWWLVVRVRMGAMFHASCVGLGLTIRPSIYQTGRRRQPDARQLRRGRQRGQQRARQVLRPLVVSESVGLVDWLVVPPFKLVA